MVESQLRPNKVTNPALLDALAAVRANCSCRRPCAAWPMSTRTSARAGTVPHGTDDPGRLLELAACGLPTSRWWSAAGIGYSAAVLARIAGRVVALESDQELAQRAAQTLQGLGVANVALVESPLADGAARLAPFDVILLDGAADRVPPAIIDQLARAVAWWR